MKLLIVDDSAMIRLILKRNCLSLGVHEDEIVEAKNGKTALARFEKHHCDGVITDWHMPAMDGLTFVREIRKQGSRVPIVMVTSANQRDRFMAAIESGVNDYLIKPFAPAEVRKKLAKLLALVKQNAAAPAPTTPGVCRGDTIAGLPDRV